MPVNSAQKLIRELATRETAAMRKAARKAASADRPGLAAAELALGIAMVRTSFKTGLDHLSQPGPLAQLVVVPTEGHLEPVKAALEALLPDAVSVHVFDDGSGGGGRAMLDRLKEEGVSIALTSDVDDMPLHLRAMCEDTVRMQPHGRNELLECIAALFGPGERMLPERLDVHPSAEAVCATLASGLHRDLVVGALARLCKAEAEDRRGELPDLADCWEFGEAREWGLGIARDVALWRAGSLVPTDLDTAALLVSPPGHGKTYFAKVLARAMGVPLHQITIGTVFSGEGHLGPVLKTLRSQFESAAAAAPCVLLIDEIDSFSRRDLHDNNQSFVASVINELLTLTDGASGKCPGLVLIGATNLPDAVDPALRRPGRMSRTITIGLPGSKGILHVLRTHLRGDLEDEDLGDIVAMTAGSTPARLMELVTTARSTARANGVPFRIEHLCEAASNGASDDPELRWRVSVHEAGHALATMVVKGAPALKAISVVPGKNTEGHVKFEKISGPLTRSTIEAEVMVHLAGRAAEAIVFGDDPGDGASADLAHATDLVASMLGRMGMGETIANAMDPGKRAMYDRDFANAIETTLRRLAAKIEELLRYRRKGLEALAEVLYRKHAVGPEEATRIAGVASWKDLDHPSPDPGTVSNRTEPETQP